MQRRHRNAAARIAAALIISICLFSHLGAIGFVGPDEPRYVWVSRAMAETRDWVTPRLYGTPWFEKPILYYWASAAGFLLHLPAEWAARLPSALAALATALALSWLAWKHYGDAAGTAQNPAMLAPLLFSTTVGAIAFARAATPDMLFAGSITLAMTSATSVLGRAGALRLFANEPSVAPRCTLLPIVMFGSFLGLAVLAKGPAAIVLAGGAIGLWAFMTKQWRAAVWVAHPVAIASFCVVALPWYILCALRNPNFVRVFIFQHNFERYVSPMFQHRQPFWFFVPIVLFALFPWTILLIPAAQDSLRVWREKSWSNSPGLYFACWAFFPVLFFSFSQSKLPSYILPAVPPLALLTAISLARLSARSSSSLRWTLMLMGITWIALAVSAAHWTKRLPANALASSPHILIVPLVIVVAAGLAIFLMGVLRKADGMLLSVLCVTLIVETAGINVLPSLDPYISGRWHAKLLADDRRPDRLFSFHLQRSWNYGLAFYLRREVPEWSPKDPEAALVLTTPVGLDELKRLGRFPGTLDEVETGILYVPVEPAQR
jgi:4-amino-4-deoxy-L-arabinose transferase-like glycosyltransferase